MTTVDRDETPTGESARSAQLRAVAGLGRLAAGASLDAVVVEAVRLVSTTLETACAGVFSHRPAESELRLEWGVGWQSGTVDSPTVAADGTTQPGYALQSTAPVVVSQQATDSRFGRSRLFDAHSITSGISVAIGSADTPWGVFGTYSTAERQFSESDVDFVAAIGHTLAAAVDRRDHTTEREALQAELTATERIAAVGQSITTALADTTSVRELEQLVCEALVGGEELIGGAELVDNRYSTAVIAHLRPKQRAVTLRATAGITDGYEAAVTDISPTALSRGIGNRVRETGETQVVDVRGSSLVPEPLRAWARDHEMRSLIAAPICHRSVCYGMVIVWSAAADGFRPREQRLLTELGETIGSVSYAINSQQFAAADRVVELSFEQRATESTPFDTELGGCTVTVDGVIQQADDTVFCYLSLTAGDPDRLVVAAASDDRIRSARTLATTPDHSILELVFEDDTVFATVSMIGGTITQATWEAGRSRLSAVFQPTVDVRWVVETVQKYHPEWGLSAKAYRDKPHQTGFDSRLQTARGRLTERQAAVLQTAFRAGYFEWPRHSTAEEVAATLGITPPTFHKHIRTCQQKLVGSLFTERLSTG